PHSDTTIGEAVQTSSKRISQKFAFRRVPLLDWFYEFQEPGIGDYFRSSIYADIESLMIHGGILQVVF
ncbi:MAG: hypothetical protein AAF497_29200, partial [Planctomycetota bacterium]